MYGSGISRDYGNGGDLGNDCHFSFVCLAYIRIQALVLLYCIIEIFITIPNVFEYLVKPP